MKEDPPKRKKFRDFVLHRPGSFLIRVLRSFRRNQGLLLAGAVAYYTLLSIIPMFALILVGLSHFIEEVTVAADHCDQPGASGPRLR